MNANPFTTMAVALALLPLAALAGADHSMPCSPHSWYIPEDSLKSTYPVYVTIDELSGGYLFSIWIYAESNGEPGLQRDDGYCYTTHADGSPVTEDTRDVIIF